MPDYRVELDAYSGPLDLLLLLVRRHEIDLHDIPIAELTDQYLRHLELIRHIDVNLAGEFLVMAATLLEIKSAMLMPRAPVPEDASEEAAAQLDPRYELVQQLLAYKRYKDAAFDLDERRRHWRDRYPLRPGRVREGGAEENGAAPVEIDLEDVHVLDLCEAFANILDSIGQGRAGHEVVNDDTPIALHAEDILDRIRRDGPMTLQEIFVGRENRTEMIGLFLATLELVRRYEIEVVQDRIAGEISLRQRSEEDRQRRSEREERARDWTDPETGEVEYEWPSAEVREAVERRAQRRNDRLKSIRMGRPVEDDDPIVDP